MTPEDRQRIIDSLGQEKILEALIPSLAALDCITEGDLQEDIGPAVRDATMTGLAALGFDRVVGTSFVSQLMGAHLEIALKRALTDDAFARQLFGMRARDVASLSDSEKLSRMLSLLEESTIPKLQEIATSRFGSQRELAGADDARPDGRRKIPLFSEASEMLIKDIAKHKGPNHADIGTIRRVTRYFIALCGDRRVNRYGAEDIQEFVTQLAFIEPNVFKKNLEMSPDDLRHHVGERQELRLRGLSRSTIENTYLDRARRIIQRGCTHARIPNLLSGTRYRVPKRAAPKRSRAPISLEKIQRVFAAGVETGLLSDMMLPLLGFLTGRRIGLLTGIQRDWVQRENGVWMVKPRAIFNDEQPDEQVDFKTSPSLKPFVLHKFFEEIGFTAWITDQNAGAVFSTLMRCSDPADAAQKRMGRLFDTAGLKKSDMETFHALRNTRIVENHATVITDRMQRIQAGHELTNPHDKYAPFLKREECETFYNFPLPPELDLSMFIDLDFEAAAIKVPSRGRRSRTT